MGYKTKEQRDAYNRAYYQKNAETQKARALAWRKANPERAQSNIRRRARELAGMVDPTGETRVGPCEMPNCTYVGPLQLDHDHATGLKRGWLCHKCNKALGLMNDNPIQLRAAADYIERHSAPPGDGVKGLSPGPTSPGP